MEIKERKLEILTAAGALLSERGMGGLTTKNLAMKVGFAESALYRHYSSKEEVIAALLQYLHGIFSERLAVATETQGAPPAERLRMLFASQLEFLSDNPHFLTAVFSEGLLAYSPSVNEGTQRLISLMQDTLGGIVEDGQRDGAFTDEVAAAELTHILLGSFRLLMLRWHISGLGFDVKAEGQKLINSLILLISKK
ncbi:MAG: TetR/AcrR family transcriptional regulator [Saprospiraceae bacterium]|jgi:AcrR family transcriptional regulator|nr:TetR/AcrR family transcriptional regulator [Saprospiraceae bacterium]